MRRARIKVVGEPMMYHLYNQVAGIPSDRPFGKVEKEKFVQLLHKLDGFFLVKVLSYTVMSNHFHLVAYAPGTLPSTEEVCRRYEEYYPGRKLSLKDPKVAVYARRMVDISWFMHDLQQQFTCWFNRTRPIRRRGSLWADRFKHTLLGDGKAAWTCVKYIEMNPVRAGMVKHPSDYRYGSFGVWAATGVHPFAPHVVDHLLPALQGMYPFSSIAQLFASLSNAYDELRPGTHTRKSWLERRARYWVDGLVIGSELFVLDTAARFRPYLRKKKHGAARIIGHGPDELFCYKHYVQI